MAMVLLRMICPHGALDSSSGEQTVNTIADLHLRCQLIETTPPATSKDLCLHAAVSIPAVSALQRSRIRSPWLQHQLGCLESSPRLMKARHSSSMAASDTSRHPTLDRSIAPFTSLISHSHSFER